MRFLRIGATFCPHELADITQNQTHFDVSTWRAAVEVCTFFPRALSPARYASPRLANITTGEELHLRDGVSRGYLWTALHRIPDSVRRPPHQTRPNVMVTGIGSRRDAKKRLGVCGRGNAPSWQHRFSVPQPRRRSGTQHNL